jgi:intracellular sulfur oxidation DsrE/DsrF family protein
MTRAFTPFLAALLLATAPMAHARDENPNAQEKVVYHVNDSANARAAMRNIQNHLNAAPDAKIVVVTHSKGIDFLLVDAKDAKGDDYSGQVAGLKAQGVDFRVCANTLKARKLEKDSVSMEATIVPSGVAEIGKLQSKEGHVYLKP